MSFTLYLLARILGCRFVGHSYYYWSTSDGGVFKTHRGCRIASCQRLEVRQGNGGWREVRRGA